MKWDIIKIMLYAYLLILTLIIHCALYPHQLQAACNKSVIGHVQTSINLCLYLRNITSASCRYLCVCKTRLSSPLVKGFKNYSGTYRSSTLTCQFCGTDRSYTTSDMRGLLLAAILCSIHFSSTSGQALTQGELLDMIMIVCSQHIALGDRLNASAYMYKPCPFGLHSHYWYRSTQVFIACNVCASIYNFVCRCPLL